MRKCFAIVLLAICPTLGPAQVLPQGSTPDVVTQALGAPRSRSATKDREIWLYPGYQVIFQRGRMISLLALPAEGGGNVEWQKRPAIPAPPASSPAGSKSPASTGTGAQVRVAPSAPGATRPNANVPGMVTSESGKRVLRSPERSVPPVRPPSSRATLSRVVWFASGLVLIGGVWIGIAMTWRRFRKRRADEAARRLADQVARAVDKAKTDTPAVPASKPPSLADWELTPDLLGAMEWKRFELMVQRYYAAAGFRTKSAGVGADDGVDLYLHRTGAQRPFSCVQCKAWNTRPVDATRVRELFAVMAAQKVPEGVLVVTGRFTPDAEAFARQNRITLVNGDDFITRFNRLPYIVRERILRDMTEGDYTTPSCPRCGVKLVLRANDRDQSTFWECQRYPRCHYTMNMRGEPEPGLRARRQETAARK